MPSSHFPSTYHCVCVHDKTIPKAYLTQLYIWLYQALLLLSLCCLVMGRCHPDNCSTHNNTWQCPHSFSPMLDLLPKLMLTTGKLASPWVPPSLFLSCFPEWSHSRNSYDWNRSEKQQRMVIVSPICSGDISFTQVQILEASLSKTLQRKSILTQSYAWSRRVLYQYTWVYRRDKNKWHLQQVILNSSKLKFRSGMQGGEAGKKRGVKGSFYEQLQDALPWSQDGMEGCRSPTFATEIFLCVWRDEKSLPSCFFCLIFQNGAPKRITVNKVW